MARTRPLTVATHALHKDTVTLLREHCGVDVCEQPPSPQALARRAVGAAAVLAFMPDRIDRPLLDACPELQIVAGAFKGADNVDVGACTACGVWVSVVPDLLSAATAELAVGLLIAVARRVREGDQAVRGGGFDGWQPGFHGMSLEGTPVGIVGMGSLGRAIARRLAGFGCRLLYADPAIAHVDGLDARPLDELLRECRAVVLALPLSAATDGLIDAERLAMMPAGAVLVNVGRGSTVDELAVAAALGAGQLAGYGADVFALEDRSRPGAPTTIPAALLEHPGSVFTPHLGTAVADVRRAIELHAATSIVQALNGERPQGAINDLLGAVVVE
jgi:phosphonate dehydrogenase